MKLVRTKFYIRTFRVGKEDHPLFARKGRSNQWDFYEGVSDRTYIDAEWEALRTARYLTKKRAGHGYTKFEVVKVEVIEREVVIFPAADVVAKLAQIAPVVYEPPTPVRRAVAKNV